MYTAFSPCMARHRRTLRLWVETSVEACWPPLTPEHGFPSLCFWPGHRALPLCPLPENRGAAGFLPYTSFLQRSGKRQGHRASPFLHRDVPTVALPTSGQRVGAFAPSQPVDSPVFRRILLHFRQRLSRGLAKAGKGAYDIFIEKTGSPLARAERRLQGLDPKPDLDHANGGK